ncbi:WD repeat-containing protein wdr-5.1 [Clarias magur]|uniref:WD repeat-containing protein wdr-5.1 n=1 Tax=Clarias magur TaxID=1594786 RepID=A0A8J4WUQ4_CLAMG|nr:WD repeat-containing protein wdr-5.1 [Clarias magur]
MRTVLIIFSAILLYLADSDSQETPNVYTPTRRHLRTGRSAPAAQTTYATTNPSNPTGPFERGHIFHDLLHDLARSAPTINCVFCRSAPVH